MCGRVRPASFLLLLFLSWGVYGGSTQGAHRRDVLLTQPLAVRALDEAAQGEHTGLRLLVFWGAEPGDQQAAARLVAQNHSGWLGRPVGTNAVTAAAAANANATATTFLFFDAAMPDKSGDVDVHSGTRQGGRSFLSKHEISADATLDKSGGDELMIALRLASTVRDHLQQVATDAAARADMVSQSSSPPTSYSASLAASSSAALSSLSPSAFSSSSTSVASLPFCTFPRAVTVAVASAEALSGDALALALKPFEEMPGSAGAAPPTAGCAKQVMGNGGVGSSSSGGGGGCDDGYCGSVSVGGSGGGSGNFGSCDSGAAVCVSLLGSDVLVPPVLTVILLFNNRSSGAGWHTLTSSGFGEGMDADANMEGGMGRCEDVDEDVDADEAATDALQEAQMTLRRSFTPRGALRTQVLKHRPVLVPFAPADAYWEAVACEALSKRSKRHGLPLPSVASCLASPFSSFEDIDSSSDSGNDDGTDSNSYIHYSRRGICDGGGRGLQRRLSALSERFVGQEPAVAALGMALTAERDDDFATGGLDGSPLVLAFLGPSGVGKTELAKQVAVVLHGNDYRFDDHTADDGHSRPSSSPHFGTAGSTSLAEVWSSRAQRAAAAVAAAVAGAKSRSSAASGEGGRGDTTTSPILVTPEQLEVVGKLKRFPMNQYQTKESLANLLGADKGHVGQCNGALTNALRAVPDAVIVLDEFEKADPSFQDACFLNAFGADGFFQDSCADNSRVPTGAATFVITSNFAAELLILDEATALSAEAQRRNPGAFSRAARNASAAAAAARAAWATDGSGRRNPFFRPEARGRVDAFVPFFPYLHHERIRVVDLQLEKAVRPIEARFKAASLLTGSVPPLTVLWTSAVTAYFASRYSPSEGLRPVINALSDITARLRTARDRGLFNPSEPPGCVVVLDIDQAVATLAGVDNAELSGDGGRDSSGGLAVHPLRLDEFSPSSRLLLNLERFHERGSSSQGFDGKSNKGCDAGEFCGARPSFSSESNYDTSHTSWPGGAARRVGEEKRESGSGSIDSNSGRSNTIEGSRSSLRNSRRSVNSGTGDMHTALAFDRVDLWQYAVWAFVVAVVAVTAMALVKTFVFVPIIAAFKMALYASAVAFALALALWFKLAPAWLHTLMASVLLALLRFVRHYPRCAAGIVGGGMVLWVWFAPSFAAAVHRARRQVEWQGQQRMRRQQKRRLESAASLSPPRCPHLATDPRLPSANTVLSTKLKDDALREVVMYLLGAFADIQHHLSTPPVDNFGETQVLLALAADATLRRHCAACDAVRTVASEERCEPISLAPMSQRSQPSETAGGARNVSFPMHPPLAALSSAPSLFDLCWKPLDGCCVMGNNLGVGSIVGIWPARTAIDKSSYGVVGLCGRDQATSVLCLYGPATSALVALDDGVYEFKHHFHPPPRNNDDNDDSGGGANDLNDEDQGSAEELGGVYGGRDNGNHGFDVGEWRWECTRARIRMPLPGEAVVGRVFSPANLRASAALAGYAALVREYAAGETDAGPSLAVSTNSGDVRRLTVPATLRYTGAVALDVYQQFTLAAYEAPIRQPPYNRSRRREQQSEVSTAPMKMPNTPKACVFVNPACEHFKAKLHLAFEAAPLAFLVEAAGGASSALEIVASDGCGEEGGDERAGSNTAPISCTTTRSVLDVPITSMTQVAPFCVGAAEEVARCNSRILYTRR